MIPWRATISGGITDSKHQQDSFPRNPIDYSVAEREVSPRKAAAGVAGLSALKGFSAFFRAKIAWTQPGISMPRRLNSVPSSR